MSRAGVGDVVIVKPQNNVYTVMVIVATVVQVLTLLVLLVRYKAVFGAFLYSA